MLPAGAKNLRLFTSKGTGDADLYVRIDGYPSQSWYTAASGNVGNAESISIAAPASGRWYYVMLKAKQPFSGVTLSATYDEALDQFVIKQRQPRLPFSYRRFYPSPLPDQRDDAL